MPPSPIFYEDFNPGQVFEAGPVSLSAEDIVAFARQFDPQPQHLSQAEAEKSQFGTLVASGWHTASVSMRLQLAAVLDRIPGGAMGAQIDTLAWRRPVHPGDALRVAVEVLAMRPTSRPGRGLLTLRARTLNQDGETVMEQTAAVLVPRRTPVEDGLGD